MSERYFRNPDTQPPAEQSPFTNWMATQGGYQRVAAGDNSFLPAPTGNNQRYAGGDGSYLPAPSGNNNSNQERWDPRSQNRNHPPNPIPQGGRAGYGVRPGEQLLPPAENPAPQYPPAQQYQPGYPPAQQYQPRYEPQAGGYPPYQRPGQQQAPFPLPGHPGETAQPKEGLNLWTVADWAGKLGGSYYAHDMFSKGLAAKHAIPVLRPGSELYNALPQFMEASTQYKYELREAREALTTSKLPDAAVNKAAVEAELAAIQGFEQHVGRHTIKKWDLTPPKVNDELSRLGRANLIDDAKAYMHQSDDLMTALEAEKAVHKQSMAQAKWGNLCVLGTGLAANYMIDKSAFGNSKPGLITTLADTGLPLVAATGMSGVKKVGIMVVGHTFARILDWGNQSKAP